MLQAGKEDIGVMVALADMELLGQARQVGAVAFSPRVAKLASAGNGELCSRGISSGPVTGSGVVALAVVLVDGGDLRNQRIIGVRVSEKRADGQQNLGDRQSG